MIEEPILYFIAKKYLIAQSTFPSLTKKIVVFLLHLTFDLIFQAIHVEPLGAYYLHITILRYGPSLYM